MQNVVGFLLLEREREREKECPLTVLWRKKCRAILISIWALLGSLMQRHYPTTLAGETDAWFSAVKGRKVMTPKCLVTRQCFSRLPRERKIYVYNAEGSVTSCMSRPTRDVNITESELVPRLRVLLITKIKLRDSRIRAVRRSRTRG